MDRLNLYLELAAIAEADARQIAAAPRPASEATLRAEIARIYGRGPLAEDILVTVLQVQRQEAALYRRKRAGEHTRLRELARRLCDQ